MTDLPCHRCGNFAEREQFWGRMLCASCIERQPLLTEPLTLRRLFAAFWTLLERAGLPIVMVHLLSALPFTLLHLAELDGTWTLLLSLAVSTVASAVCVRATILQAVLGGPLRLNEAVSRVRERFWLLTVASLAATALALLFGVLLLVPGIMRMLSYALVTAIAVCDPVAEPWDVVQRSSARMKGRRWVALAGYVGVYVVTWAPLVLVAILVGAMGAKPAGLPLIAQTLAGLLTSGLDGIAVLVTATLYLKLTRPDLWPVDESDIPR